MPKDENELRVMMFRKDTPDEEEQYIYGDEAFSHKCMAASLFAEITDKNNILSGDEAILEEISSGYFDGYPELDYQDHECRKIEEEFRAKYNSDVREAFDSKDKKKKAIYLKWSKALNAMFKRERDKVNACAKKYFYRLKSAFKGRTVVKVSYGDHDGPFGAQMEHSGILLNIKDVNAIRISHH
jgi:hypothetical protein